MANEVKDSASAEVKDVASVVFTFGGGAWYYFFYLGVGAAVADFSKDRADPAVRFCGVSAGSLVASSLAHQMDMNKLWEQALLLASEVGHNPLRLRDGLYRTCKEMLVSDESWQVVSQQKRLLVGISKQTWNLKLQPCSVTEFRDQAHADAVAKASIHMPMLFGVRGFLVDGERYFDGQLTQWWQCLPVFSDIDERIDTVIRITCYHDESYAGFREGWITPQLQLPQKWQFFPPCAESVRLMWQLGYLRFAEYLAKSESREKLQEHFHPLNKAAQTQFATELDQTTRKLREAMEESQMVVS